jgi:tetratricopeptide (TPR) repeat protein
LGKALAQNGKIFQAVYELEYALQLDPQLASAHFALGNLSMNQQLWRKAIDHLQATVKQQPQNQRAWFLLATCYGKVHESPTKRAILERLTREHPDNATYQKQLAYEYLFFNQFSRAEACARRALQTKPKDDEARYILGRALAEQANTPDEFDAAKRELDAALKAQPNDPHGHLAMGILRYRQGDYAKAASALEKSLALGVPETKAKMYLGQTYLRLGKQREGKFLLDVYRREGEILRETRQLELHLSNKPSDVNMRLKLAKLFLQVGRVAPAVQQLQIVLQMQPNHPEASRLLKTLQQ